MIKLINERSYLEQFVKLIDERAELQYFVKLIDERTDLFIRKKDSEYTWSSKFGPAEICLEGEVVCIYNILLTKPKEYLKISSYEDAKKILAKVILILYEFNFYKDVFNNNYIFANSNKITIRYNSKSSFYFTLDKFHKKSFPEIKERLGIIADGVIIKRTYFESAKPLKVMFLYMELDILYKKEFYD